MSDFASGYEQQPMKVISRCEGLKVSAGKAKSSQTRVRQEDTFLRDSERGQVQRSGKERSVGFREAEPHVKPPLAILMFP